MWIWELDHTSGGDPQAIADQALANHVNTVFVKAGDGSSAWAQFSSTLVSALKARGLKVCAWQYVYGAHPADEAVVGAGAVALGADCLIIDAESEYEGRYAQAQTYLQNLRASIGSAYPVGLAGFPYVDYHPSFPYSVFLGPGGAQYNVPQMYWKDIGVSVDTVYAHTYLWNVLYTRPIFPLGQIWQDPAPSELMRFRQLAAAYGATGVSWWDYQEASARGWATIGQPLTPLTGFTPTTGYPTLGPGSKGDVVVWAQEHLVSAGQPVSINGVFDSNTQNAVAAQQSAAGLPATGQIDTPTWQALLRYVPAPRTWTAKASAARAGAPRAAAARAVAQGRNGPRSAMLPAVRDEISPRSHGRG
jgi:hypothetical protein